MSARDIFHNAVKQALIKENWRITHDPYHLDLGGVEMYVDLGAEQLIAAQREDVKIAVEVKTFIRASNIHEFHNAVGQFMNYRLALRQIEAERTIYLAIPDDIYNIFFKLEFIQLAIQDYDLKILVFEPEEEAILAWIK